MTAPYIIVGSEAGAERLEVLAAATWLHCERFLREAGLGAGAKVLDVGCGNGAMSLRIAEAIGSTGHLTGMDRDVEMIRYAQAETQVRGLAAEFHCGDIERDVPPGGDYDLAFARCLLSHLRDPAAAVAKLAAVLGPGGCSRWRT